MSTLIFRSLFVLIFCAVTNAFAAQNVLMQTNTLIQQGKTDDFIGNSPKAIDEFRQALMFQLSNPEFDDAQIFDTLNMYGESYARIGLFSMVTDRDKDEALLRSLAQHVKAEKNINMAQMVHGLLLSFGEQKFGIPSKGIQYSYLRADPLKPICTLEKPLPRIANVNNINGLEPCQQNHAFFELVNPAITPEVKAYRQYEIDFFNSTVRPLLSEN